MIKRHIIILLFTSCCFACKATKEIISIDSIIFKIDFQNNFVKNDKISLLINGCKVFENKTFESDPVIGFTREEVVAKRNGNVMLLTFESDSISCTIDGVKAIKLEVKLNEVSKIYNLNIVKDKYIGVSNSKMGIIIVQQNTEFVYD